MSRSTFGELAKRQSFLSDSQNGSCCRRCSKSSVRREATRSSRRGRDRESASATWGGARLLPVIYLGCDLVSSLVGDRTSGKLRTDHLLYQWLEWKWIEGYQLRRMRKSIWWELDVINTHLLPFILFQLIPNVASMEEKLRQFAGIMDADEVRLDKRFELTVVALGLVIRESNFSCYRSSSTRHSRRHPSIRKVVQHHQAV